MRKLAFRLAVVLFAAPWIYGCQETVLDPTEAADYATYNFRVTPNQSVTGHAEAFYPEFGELFEDNSFSAVRHADGSVTGEWHSSIVWEGEPLTIHGDVTCFTIAPDGKTAWLGGTVERAPWGDPTQFQANWTVVDNGEPGAGNDLTNGITFDTFIDAAYHCATGDGFMYAELRPIDRGNIQVKP